MMLRTARQTTQKHALGAALVALALAIPPSLEGQDVEGTARMVGTVFDSTSMELLEGARVAVIGTNAFGDTDDNGWFELEDVPAGTHWVSFFHPRLQTLGVSPPSRQVTFQKDATAQIDLAVPSQRTLLKGWCRAEQPGEGYAALAGTVTDSLTGVPMPRAIVTASPADAQFGVEPVEVRTDESGYYRMCAVPGGRPLRLQAHFGNSSGRSMTVSVEPGEARMQDLMLLMSAEGTLAGQVVDYISGQPVAGADVSVLGTDARALTDSLGNFVFDDLPPGRHLLTTDHLAFEQRTDSITILSQETVGIEVRLATEALEVEGLVVTARSRFGRNTLVTAKRRDVITREEIEPLLTRVQHAGDLLRNMNAPGLNIREIYVEDATGIRIPGLCVEVTRRTGGNEQCASAAVLLNEVLVPYPDQVLRDLDPAIIDHIEILRPVDAQFRFGTMAANGAVLIYTR